MDCWLRLSDRTCLHQLDRSLRARFEAKPAGTALVRVGRVGDPAAVNPVLDLADEAEVAEVRLVDPADLEHVVRADGNACVLAFAAVEIHHRDYRADPVGEASVLGHRDQPVFAAWRRRLAAKSANVVVGLPSAFHVPAA